MNSWRASLFSLSNVLIIYLIFTFVHKIISYFGVTVEAKNSARLSFGYFCVPVRHFFLCVMKKNLPAIFSMACISSNYFRSFAESFSPVYFESSLFSMLYVVHITVCVLKDVSILFLLSPSLSSFSPGCLCRSVIFLHARMQFPYDKSPS